MDQHIPHELRQALTPTHPAGLVTVREAVLRLLQGFGMTSIFGNPGSTELPLFMDFPQDFRYVLGLQECVVVGMADGYAQATGNAAFINLHSAAGVGHAMGNIFTAFRNRTPLVITAGQQARSILPFDPFLGSTNAPELPRPYVKWSVEPARAEDVPLAIARAYYIAMTPPRGPVFVSIPSDDWAVLTAPVEPRDVSRHIRPDPAVLNRIGAALDAAQAPAIVVGASVDRDGAWAEAIRLAERHGARVYVAPMSGRCSFPEDHPLWAGFLPAMRERIVDRLRGHDLVFALGAPAFTYHVEGPGPHLPEGAELVQLTEDPQVAAWAPSGTAAVGSIRLGLLDLLDRAPPPARPMPARHARPARVPEPAAGERLPVDWVLQTLTDMRPRDSIIVEEAPSARATMHAHLPIFESETFYTMCSGGLGWGLPASVGVAMGKPGARVIGVIGDGSAMYAIQALWSAAQMGLATTTVILNNRRYAALHEFARIFGYPPGAPVPGTELPDIDFVGLAAAQGVRGIRVQRPDQLRAALREGLTSKQPLLIEVEIAASQPSHFPLPPSAAASGLASSPMTSQAGDKALNTIPMLINGESRQASNGATFQRRNPLDGSVATVAPAATTADAIAAVEAAAAAFPAWSRTGPGERRTLLLKAAHALESKAQQLTEAMAAEIGAAAPWAGFNVHLAAGMLEEAASITTQVGGEVIPSNVPGSLALAVRRPAGVVLGIAPWNAPVILGVRAIATPLACGNTVVFKGSELSPATQGLIVEAFQEAGFPPGVVNFITNAPADAPSIVEAIVAHPAVRRVNFTGSTRVGKLLALTCAKYLKPVVLELGGKAPLVVLDDADLDAAVNGTAFGAFANSGQICMSTERIIVDQGIADDFVARLVAKARKLPLGDPRKGPVVLGSVVDASTVERCNGLIDDALAKGATLVCGGKAENTLMPATLLDHVTADMRIYHEESFGPVKPIVRVDGVEDAVRVANDNPYGLSAAVFGRDIARAWEVANRIDSGICHVNGPTVHDEAQMPFGGVKDSGHGRFGGRAGIDAFTELRWITIQTSERHYPF